MKNKFLEELQKAPIWAGISISKGWAGIKMRMVLGNTEEAAKFLKKTNKNLKLPDILEGFAWLEERGLNIAFWDTLTLVSKKLKEEKQKELTKIPVEVKALVGETYVRDFGGGKIEIFFVEDIYINETLKRAGLVWERNWKRQELSLTEKLVLTWKRIVSKDNGVSFSEIEATEKKYTFFIASLYSLNSIYGKLFG